MRFVQAGLLLLGSACYLGVLSVFPGATFTGVDTNAVLLFGVGGWIAALLIVTALVIVDSVRKARAGRTQDLATDLFVVKLASVPFFLVNYAVLSTIVLLGTGLVSASSIFTGSGDYVAEFAGFAVAGAAIMIGLTYLVMLTTSTYGWATIAQLRRGGRIGAGLGVLYRLMLVIFVLDVVAGILLYVHSRRAQAASPATDTDAESRVPVARPMRLVQAGTLLLGAVMYGLVIAFSGELSSAYNLHWIFFIVGGWNTLLIVVTALVVVDTVGKIRAGKTQALATGALVVKLAAIPFFLLNFFVLAVLAVGGIAIIILGGVVLLIAVVIGSVLTYLTMLSTSVYAWAAIAQLRRAGIIGTGLAALYMFMSFVFVTDIVAAVLLFGQSRRRPGRALVVVLVVLGAILAVVGFALAPTASTPDYIADAVGWMPYVSIAGIALTLATVVVSLVRLITVRRRTRQLSTMAGD